ncbi:hypothetical protein HPB48_026869 [Haemaphysalis longicornis]|uniref:CCHC-type domain-containing protein n=1 Tax=Haemaphysalis longicornis TaxID=44386 RepID=A0A9J6HDF2_HAELO|nr:hypothetical protein HPB48_026869 [Haemaphysalis longicornis]
MKHEASGDDKPDTLPDEDDPLCIHVVSSVQPRRQRKAEHELSLPSSAPVMQASPDTRKPLPRPSRLPRGGCKLVLRLQDGLKLSETEPSMLALALLQATNSTGPQGNLHLRIEPKQNTATISTPFKHIARALSRLTEMHIFNDMHTVQLHGLAPNLSVKGVIRGVPTELTEAEILKNIDQDKFEVYSCRELGKGKELTIVVLTFPRPNVPYYARLYGDEHICSRYKKAVLVCSRCHEVGHRITACPHPNIRVFHESGIQNRFTIPVRLRANFARTQISPEPRTPPSVLLHPILSEKESIRIARQNNVPSYVTRPPSAGEISVPVLYPATEAVTKQVLRTVMKGPQFQQD